MPAACRPPTCFSTSAITLAKKSKAKKQAQPLDHDLDESSATVLQPTKGSKGKKSKLLVTASGSQPYDSQSEFALAEGEEEGLDDEDYDDRLVQGKVKPKMQKTFDWAKAVVFEGVERGRGRISPGEGSNYPAVGHFAEAL